MTPNLINKSYDVNKYVGEDDLKNKSKKRIKNKRNAKLEKNHNSLVNIVKQNLIEKGFTDVHLHTNYADAVSGEIDIFAVDSNYVLCFEIKCNYTKKSYESALDQLSKAKRFFFDDSFKFYGFMVYDLKNPTYKRLV